jgi:hypothetical protein
MGHANRSRLDDALGLDAQSRRVRFPSAWRRRNPDPHANGDCDRDSYSNCYTDGNDDSSSIAHAYSDGATTDNTYATAASDASASPVMVTSES